MLGLTLQRGLLICFTFIIIGLPFWLHIEPLLILCGALFSSTNPAEPPYSYALVGNGWAVGCRT